MRMFSNIVNGSLAAYEDRARAELDAAIAETGYDPPTVTAGRLPEESYGSVRSVTSE